MALRKRIGVMVPSTNTTFEADFQMVAPRDVTIHGQRLWLTNDAPGEAGMDRMNSEVESGARYLPVVQEGKLLGVISFRDVAKAVLEEQDFENKMLKGYIKNWPA